MPCQGELMSAFTVSVTRVTIESHPDPTATQIEVARVGDYTCVVRKGQFTTGDLVAYIPEASLLPQALLDELSLTGRLAGPDGNRLKAIRLRGVVSQGICYTARPGWVEDQDVAEELGITKWEPPVPACLSGNVWFAGGRRTLGYDIENFKKYPCVIRDGEEVVMTEKIHGSFCGIGWMPPSLVDPEHGDVVVFSKGLGAKGLALKPNDEANASNVYLRVAARLDTPAFRQVMNEFTQHRTVACFVLGEVFGKGIQDLHYGASTDSAITLGFRIFDVFIGSPGVPGSMFLSDNDLTRFCAAARIERVPVLYRGPFTRERLIMATTGNECVSGQECNIREGCVVRTTVERRDQKLGRVQLKSVSDDYTFRKNKNATEFN